MQNILILKTSSLGDIIQSFPFLEYLRQKFPEAKIDWVVEKPFSELVKAHPYINETICVDTKAWRKKPFSSLKEIKTFWHALRRASYDAVFDLQGNIKSSLILSQVRSAAKIGFGKKTVHEWPNLLFTNIKFDPQSGLNIREDNLFLATQYLKDSLPLFPEPVLLNIDAKQQQKIKSILNHPIISNKRKILICPGSAWPNKQLTHESMQQLITNLETQQPTGFLFAWGSNKEKELVEKLKAENSVVIDRLPLAALQHLMDGVDLIVAMDSLPLHLAGTTKTATLSFFGPSLASKFKPLGEQHKAYQGTCPYGRTFEKRCPILRSCPTGKCMRDFDL